MTAVNEQNRGGIRNDLSVYVCLLALAGLQFLIAYQSFAFCYTQAASSGSRMIEALRSGILILIAPPTLMSVGMIFIVYRKRNQFRQDDHNREDDMRSGSDRDW